MRRITSWILPRGLAALLLLALPACVEGTTTSGTATSPNEATGTTAPVATTPVAPATPATPAAPISAHPTTTAVTPVATAPATPTTIPTVAPTATAPTSIPGTTPAAGSLAGTWESASCGARAYPRRITFAEPASFSAEDLVSPCPKGTTCVWSGIINRSGSYKTQKDIVTLTVSKTGNGPAKTQFPPSLTLDSHGLVEAGSDGKPCAYTHAGGERKP
jgi:hypothetical protein